MSNTESISARLRRWSNKDECLLPLQTARDEYGIDESEGWRDLREVFINIADEIDREMDELLESFANPRYVNIENAVREVALGIDEHGRTKDAIERYYLPRPLFEDGEPVNLGDRYLMMNGTPDIASSFAYTKGDADYVRINGHRTELHERVKRPKQPVLDADGVPIEVGDEIWNIKTGARYIVEKMGSDGCYDCHEMVIRNESGLTLRAMGKFYTHREPDTQERIDKDAVKSVCSYFGFRAKPCSECPAYGSEIGCSNEKVRDLLRRQRELDGRDA